MVKNGKINMSENSFIKKIAVQVLKQEARSVNEQLSHIDENFVLAVKTVLNTSGKIVLLGVGKSGIIARKIAATLSSLGVNAVYLHPTDCLHGDAGAIQKEDTAIVLSYSGESEEIKLLLNLLLQTLKVKVIIFTANRNLLKRKDVIGINCRVSREAEKHNVVPTSSTTATLALGDALALAVAKERGWTPADFSRIHPRGHLGKKTGMLVRDIMRRGKDNPVINKNRSVSEALIIMTRTRVGAVSVVDKSKKLVGYFTDGDLRRWLTRDKNIWRKKLHQVMTPNPRTISPDMPVVAAMNFFRKFSFDNAPVVDKNMHPVGLLDERDLIAAGVVI